MKKSYLYECVSRLPANIKFYSSFASLKCCPWNYQSGWKKKTFGPFPSGSFKCQNFISIYKLYTQRKMYFLAAEYSLNVLKGNGCKCYWRALCLLLPQLTGPSLLLKPQPSQLCQTSLKIALLNVQSPHANLTLTMANWKQGQTVELCSSALSLNTPHSPWRAASSCPHPWEPSCCNEQGNFSPLLLVFTNWASGGTSSYIPTLKAHPILQACEAALKQCCKWSWRGHCWVRWALKDGGQAALHPVGWPAAPVHYLWYVNTRSRRFYLINSWQAGLLGPGPSAAFGSPQAPLATPAAAHEGRCQQALAAGLEVVAARPVQRHLGYLSMERDGTQSLQMCTLAGKEPQFMRCVVVLLRFQLCKLWFDFSLAR